MNSDANLIHLIKIQVFTPKLFSQKYAISKRCTAFPPLPIFSEFEGSLYNQNHGNVYM
jgi:hypothetical protein